MPRAYTQCHAAVTADPTPTPPCSIRIFGIIGDRRRFDRRSS
jgi:hypothetical protein